jgi:hypothetical protein
MMSTVYLYQHMMQSISTNTYFGGVFRVEVRHARRVCKNGYNIPGNATSAMLLWLQHAIIHVSRSHGPVQRC